MKIGDLVKRNGVNASKELGIIVEVEDDDSMYVPHVFVSWSGKNPDIYRQKLRSLLFPFWQPSRLV